jgi:acetolactate synthase-1/2/3 large subunit
MKYSGADFIIKMLETNKTEYVFGVPGGHLLKFYDSLFNSDELNPILTKHESGASFMATGYAQVSKGLGVCTGTVGPGATNLTTGVASAYMDSIPLLVLTAQVGLSAVGKGGLQEATGVGRTIDHVELFDGMTKSSERVLNINKLRESFRNALRLSVNGRPGPVHLDVMANIFTAEIEINEQQLKEEVQRFRTVAPDSEVKKAADFLLSARNPVILAGAGALGADKEIRELAETCRIPVATTLRAKGLLPEDHELSMGCVGLYGTNLANKYLRTNIDVLLAVGTSFSEFTTHAWDSRFQPDMALIQIDVDSWELGKNYPVSLGLAGDAKLVLGQLLSSMKYGTKRGDTASTTNLAKMKHERQYFADPVMQSEATPIKPQRFMKSLRNSLPRDTIVFGDIGNTLPWLEGFFQALVPDSFYICSSLASMGYGVSAAIGGQLAAPNRQVICVCGDGDFQMQGLEVITAVNYNIPVKWFILNNQSLAMIKDLQKIMFGGRKIASEFINPDFVKLAEAMGAVGLRITQPNEIEEKVTEALKNNRPTVVDVLIDPDEAPSFDARAEAMTRAWGTSASLFQKLKLVPKLMKRM